MDKLNSQKMNNILGNCCAFNNDELDLWNYDIHLDEKKTYLCNIDLFNKDSKKTSLKVSLKLVKNRPITRIVSLLSYKLINFKRVYLANISLGNLKERNAILIDINKIQSIK